MKYTKKKKFGDICAKCQRRERYDEKQTESKQNSIDFAYDLFYS